MIATQQNYANVFMAGLLPRENKLGMKEFHEIKKPEVILQSKEEIKVTIKLGEPIYIGNQGEKKYKLTLEEFAEDVLVLRTIDVSRGAGHVVIKKQFIKTKSKEIIATIKK